MSEKSVDFPAPFGPTSPMRSPRLTWSETSSKRMRPAKDFDLGNGEHREKRAMSPCSTPGATAVAPDMKRRRIVLRDQTFTL